MKKPLYETEAALCADFIAWVKAKSGTTEYGRTIPRWTPYAETAGWDILLVAEDGTQIGVQAKLRFNMKVLHQSIPSGSYDAWRETGPDYRAILIPERDTVVDDICGALGLVVFHPYNNWNRDHQGFEPQLDLGHRFAGDWHYWSPQQRHELPEFVPDVIAGDSGPVQLTKWKIAALRIVANLEVKGEVTRADFKRYSVDPRRWLGPHGWLDATDKPGVYKRGAALDFDKQHPVVYEQVLAEVREQHRQFLEAQ